MQACALRAAFEAAQITRRAGQVDAHDGMIAMIRSSPDRVARTKQSDDRAAERDGKMHRAGIMGDADLCAAYQSCKLAQRCLSGEIDNSGREAGDIGRDVALARRADQDHGMSALQEVLRDSGELLVGPALRLPIPPRREQDKTRIADAMPA